MERVIREGDREHDEGGVRDNREERGGERVTRWREQPEGERAREHDEGETGDAWRSWRGVGGESSEGERLHGIMGMGRERDIKRKWGIGMGEGHQGERDIEK